MKKKIAFVSKKMDMGGVEKTALYILNMLNPEKFRVDYFYRRREHENVGELFDDIPKWINKKEIEIPNKNNYKELFHTHKERFIFFIRYIQSYLCKNANQGRQYSLQAKLTVEQDEVYDLAIAYDGASAYGVFYTIEKVKAKKKILWIHDDIRKRNATSKIFFKYYNAYDKIIAVSQDSKNILIDTFPELRNKVEVQYNYVNYEEIRNKALEKICSPFEGFDGIKIATVGRLSKDKGVLMAAECCKMLVMNGINVKWVICGEGPQRKVLSEYIRENKLNEHFILLGNQDNPYPFINDCDIYVQTSIVEGFCTTTNEARVLQKPVVTTDVCGMREQFQDHITGLIVNGTVLGIYNGILELINDKDLRENIKRNLEKINWEKQIDYNKLLDEFID